MLTRDAEIDRSLNSVNVDADLIVVGGGMAGCCCAITAARAGIKVALVQDRPVLGGNASSEVRLWILGATSHMGNNNRWAREGGVIDEILVENMYRNPEGNAVILDTVILEKVSAEKNIVLLLNTAVHDLTKNDDGSIRSVRAFCSQNSTQYELRSPVFCDASGDGIVSFLAGAAFRMGAESQVEFGEMLAPSKEHRDLLGHSIYFYSRDTGRPVEFVPPAYALDDITKIPRYRRFNAKEHGCQLWWIEYGGSRDTIHDSEDIKWELWSIVYGVWDHIKNSGEFPEAENLTLEWVGQIPGKRESRRFEGDYMLVQQNIVEQRTHYDVVSYGGWAIDLHPVDGVYSSSSPCTQWHSKGVYEIPYRTMYSRNVANLFLAGRIISASHIAFGSTRVMATCAHNAQAVGMAAVICREQNLVPKELASPQRIVELQQRLLAAGQYIPRMKLNDPDDLVHNATITASSKLKLLELATDDQTVCLSESRGMLLPVPAGTLPEITFLVEANTDTEITAQFRICSRTGSFTPDIVLEEQIIPIGATQSVPNKGTDGSRRPHNGNGHKIGRSTKLYDDDDGVSTESTSQTATVPECEEETVRAIRLQFQAQIPHPCYAVVCLMANPHVRVHTTDRFVTGVMQLVHRENSRVAGGMVQEPPAGAGIEGFEFWTPERRPAGRNLAMRFEPALEEFGPHRVANGIARPVGSPNAWVADFRDRQPTLELRWESPQIISRIELAFDTDLEHPMETVLMGHPERVMPYCVRSYRVRGFRGQLLAECHDNHQTRNTVRLSPPVKTDQLTIELDAPSKSVAASLFEVRCYSA